MADWSKILSRGDVEDRRGSPVGLAGGGLGILGIGIVLVLSLLGGDSADVNDVLNQLQQTGVQSAYTSQDFEGEDDYERFTSTVLGSTNEHWRQVFAQTNQTYEPPLLVLFRTGTQSGCGLATSSVGPHYCPTDKTIYIDETFYDELQNRFGAQGGDVAEAYVMAHEVGHHVQYQLGLLNTTGQSSNEESIATELQADCFAGTWAHSVANLGVFQAGEINEALDAAAAVGDDRIQSKVQGQIQPETWTHGSSEQRTYWFNQGFTSGDPSNCNVPSS